MQQAKFPMVCIDIKHAVNSNVIVLLQSDKLRMHKGAAEFFQKEMVGLKFCDMNGKVFQLKRVDFTLEKNIIQYFRFALSFPEVAMFEFRPTSERFTLSDFKERCKELIRLESIEEVWERECREIEKAQNFQEAVGLFGLGWQNEVFE